MNKYELIVIGLGPAGEQAALKASCLGYKVALIDNEEFGRLDSSVITPFNASAFSFLEQSEQKLLSAHEEFKRHATAAHYRYRKNYLFDQEAKAIKENLKKNGVDQYTGLASFEDSHTLVIARDKPQRLYGNYILISTGSYPDHPSGIPFDGKRIHDPDSILNIDVLPRSICIVGAGITGCEYTTIFSNLRTEVTLINNKEIILPQIDREVSAEFLYQMKQEGVNIFLNTSVKEIDVPQDSATPLTITLENGKKIEADHFLFAAGRRGNTKGLQADKIGLNINERGNIIVGPTFRSNIDHIYAVGDVIGFSSLGSTSMDQGRLAVAQMFNKKNRNKLPLVFPYGIYTVPEISMVGMTEEEAQKQNFNYRTSVVKYSDNARARLMGLKRGLLKIIFDESDLSILGVHIIGRMATELIHYGAEMIEHNQTLDAIAEDIFNYPSLHSLYKSAAYEGLKQMTR